MSASTPATNPWYREPWPWLLMAGPAIVVVAGFITLGLAIQSSDGLVADDYYKEGKAINMTISRDQRAQELGYAASLTPSTDGRILLSFAASSPVSAQLQLTLHHPTRAGSDHVLQLVRTTPGTYLGSLADFSRSRWGMTVEDGTRSWRLTGSWNPGDTSVSLGRQPVKP